jgi:hypothetical protein
MSELLGSAGEKIAEATSQLLGSAGEEIAEATSQLTESAGESLPTELQSVPVASGSTAATTDAGAGEGISQDKGSPSAETHGSEGQSGGQRESLNRNPEMNSSADRHPAEQGKALNANPETAQGSEVGHLEADPKPETGQTKETGYSGHESPPGAPDVRAAESNASKAADEAVAPDEVHEGDSLEDGAASGTETEGSTSLDEAVVSEEDVPRDTGKFDTKDSADADSDPAATENSDGEGRTEGASSGSGTDNEQRPEAPEEPTDPASPKSGQSASDATAREVAEDGSPAGPVSVWEKAVVWADKRVDEEAKKAQNPLDHLPGTPLQDPKEVLIGAAGDVALDVAEDVGAALVTGNDLPSLVDLIAGHGGALVHGTGDPLLNGGAGSAFIGFAWGWKNRDGLVTQALNFIADTRAWLASHTL